MGPVTHPEAATFAGSPALVRLVTANRSVLGLAVMLAISLATAVGWSTETHADARCSASGSRTLIENTAVRVYTRADTDGPARSYTTYACLKENGKTAELDQPGAEVYAYSPPAMALAGSVIGYAVDFCDAELCHTSVSARDLRRSLLTCVLDPRRDSRLSQLEALSSPPMRPSPGSRAAPASHLEAFAVRRSGERRTSTASARAAPTHASWPPAET